MAINEQKGLEPLDEIGITLPDWFSDAFDAGYKAAYNAIIRLLEEKQSFQQSNGFDAAIGYVKQHKRNVVKG